MNINWFEFQSKCKVFTHPGGGGLKPFLEPGARRFFVKKKDSTFERTRKLSREQLIKKVRP